MNDMISVAVVYPWLSTCVYIGGMRGCNQFFKKLKNLI